MYKKRFIEQHWQTLAKFFKVILVTGARQVGKTTFLKNSLPNTALYTFEQHQDTYGAQKDPERFIQSIPRPSILDEVQFVPNIFSSIKREVDRRDTPGQYFLTGSQNLTILPHTTESMAGRVGIIQMHPLSLYEAADASDKSWLKTYLESPEISETPLSTVSLFSLYEAVWRGNLPQSILSPSLDPLVAFFAGYVQTVLEQDVRFVSHLGSLNDFQKFMALCARMTAQEVSPTQLGREIGITNKTARTWLNLLLATYQWHEIKAFSGNTTKRISTKTKGYWSDTGIACSLLDLRSPTSLASHPQSGFLVETWIINSIIQQSQTLAGAKTPTLYHWRSHRGAEIDLIISFDGTLYPIEIKSTEMATAKDTRGIRAFHEAYPHENIAHGLIIYAGDRCYRINEYATALPWNACLP